MKRSELKQMDSSAIRDRMARLREHRDAYEGSTDGSPGYANLMVNLYQGLMDHLEHELEDRGE